MSSPYTTAIEALEREIASRQDLLNQLRRHVGAEPAKQWSAPTVTEVEKPKRKNRRGGRPPIDPGDKVRAAKAAMMRKRRQRLREAAAATTSASPENAPTAMTTAPEPSPELRQRYSAMKARENA
jgi:hypothetical protein